MRRNKSTPEDEIILSDENADPVERSSSAKKLLSDGYGKSVFGKIQFAKTYLNFKA